MKDIEVKEKLESLSPLAGGVVYGKEEAWDKLQARLEKKPARKYPLLRLSAAAILLLTVAIAGYIYNTKPADTNNGQPVASVSIAENNTPIPQSETIVPEVLRQEPETSRIVNTLPRTYKIAMQPQTVIEIQTEEPMPQVIDETPVVANIVPVKQVTPIHKMRVVHINDVGKPEEETEPSYVCNSPALDLTKMKVVSLNDVQREESRRKQEEEVITMIRINRPHGGFLGFANTVGWGNSYQRTYAQNPLSIRLNRNN
jgi:hypothetical protein